MKSSKEIKRERDELRDEINRTKATIDGIYSAIRQADRHTERAQLVTLCRRKEAAEHKINRLEKIAAVLRHNYRAALVAEVLPEILRIMHEYKGKRLGEKTREKVRDAMRAATGCGVAFCGSELHIWEYRADGIGENIDLYADASKGAEFTDMSTITGEVKQENIYNYEDITEYIEDPAAYIERVEALQEAAEAAREEYNNAAAEYNAKILVLGNAFREMRHAI